VYCHKGPAPFNCEQRPLFIVSEASINELRINLPQQVKIEVPEEEFTFGRRKPRLIQSDCDYVEREPTPPPSFGRRSSPRTNTAASDFREARQVSGPTNLKTSSLSPSWNQRFYPTNDSELESNDQRRTGDDWACSSDIVAAAWDDNESLIGSDSELLSDHEDETDYGWYLTLPSAEEVAAILLSNQQSREAEPDPESESVLESESKEDPTPLPLIAENDTDSHVQEILLSVFSQVTNLTSEIYRHPRRATILGSRDGLYFDKIGTLLKVQSDTFEIIERDKPPDLGLVSLLKYLTNAQKVRYTHRPFIQRILISFSSPPILRLAGFLSDQLCCSVFLTPPITGVFVTFNRFLDGLDCLIPTSYHCVGYIRSDRANRSDNYSTRFQGGGRLNDSKRSLSRQ
jgi:hypothetical protein